MSPPIHKQHPSFPALFGSVAFLALGLFCYMVANDRVDAGEPEAERLYLLVLGAVVVSAIFLVESFSHYRFTHQKGSLHKRPHGEDERKQERM